MTGSPSFARGFLGLALLILPACLSSGSAGIGPGEPDLEPRAPTSPGTAFEGVWGGTGIRLTLTGTSGTLEFDCGGATIENLVVSPSTRRFRAQGMLSPAVAGPAVYPPPPGREPRPARFRGRLRRDRLRLVVVLAKPRPEGEPRRTVYRLEQGSSGELRKCR